MTEPDPLEVLPWETLDEVAHKAMEETPDPEASGPSAVTPPDEVSVQRFSGIMHRLLTLQEQEDQVKMLSARMIQDIQSQRGRLLGWYGMALDAYAQKAIGSSKPRRKQILGVGEFSLKAQPVRLEVPDHTRDLGFQMFTLAHPECLRTSITIEGVNPEQALKIQEAAKRMKLHSYKKVEVKKKAVQDLWKATITKEKPQGEVPPGCSVKKSRDKLYLSRTGD